MYLNDFIARLQSLRAQYGDLAVWVDRGTPPMTVTVEEVWPTNPKANDEPEKVVVIRSPVSDD
jgi:hypothetical protein